ncbi:MAG: hypothetical protein M1818_005263 [Claussenomyces sp. TS43310]|nr:MAG: hypothetical protein M1818_005263 [Claussenomyces sp. TS43310]
MSHHARPASPTLTNPDMILPYGDYDSTPSTPEQALSHPSHWSGGRLEDIDFSIASSGRALGSVTPTTPIIYGNGTMLSDIGEVTEAESTPGKQVRAGNPRIARTLDMPPKSSLTAGFDAALKRAKLGNHQRQVSVESTSTVITHGQAAEMHFEGFDDGVSVDDSNFQGDDEESVVDENYGRRKRATEDASPERRDKAKATSADQDALSSAALSRRAELILANAKKRLDSMEGNLTRARSSLYITPSSSMSSTNGSSPRSRSTPSPSGSGLRIVPQLGMPPSRHRQVPNIYPSPTSPGHMRILSENSLPSSLHTSSYDAGLLGALGREAISSTLPHESGNDDFHDNSKSIPRPYQSSPLARSPNFSTHTLENLREDDTSPSYETNLERVRPSTAEPYQHIFGDGRGLTRSASSMQMRDLTDKMRDLKGRISTLRDRAREDNMKRRSLQTLRTPSPFTAAEHWQFSGNGLKPDGSRLVDSTIIRNPWNGEPSLTSEEEEEHVGDRSVSAPPADLAVEALEITKQSESLPEAEDTITHIQQDQPAIIVEIEDEENYETAEELESNAEDEEDEEDDYSEELVSREELEDYRSESEASHYHDSVATQISHEDREDAFDYEHFFLHSAMGTLSPQQMQRRESTSSLGSEDSVETTRGPPAPPSDNAEKESESRTANGHVRNQSADSISTLATFATATEGHHEETHESASLADDSSDGSSVGASTPKTIIPLDFHIPGESGKPDAKQMALEQSTSRPNSVLRNGLRHVNGESRSTSQQSNSPRGSILRNDESVNDRDSQGTPEQPYSRPSSVLRNGEKEHARMTRPSISSMSSTGSTRSFPLVNKPKGSTPAPVAVAISKDPAAAILSEAVTLTEDVGTDGRRQSPVSMLLRDDQILVERLVASLGKCVLGLQEAGPETSAEGRMWRGRLDMARRVLEGEALRSAISIEELRSRRTTGLAARTSRRV